MDTTGTRIVLGTILLFLLCLPYFSTTEFIYRPVELFSINCGSSGNLSTLDGRNWTGDMKFLSESHDSVAATAITPSTQQGPYTSARLSRSQFTYSFPVTTGPKFLRLFFYSTSYQNFDRPKAYFSVKAGSYTLLKNFNASLNADADDDPGHRDTLFREYCINVLEDGERLNITFIPSTTDSYAFINGIEIVSMPPYLYYTNSNIDSDELPQLVGGATYLIKSNSALETKYRLRGGEADIPPSGDTGMLRTWEADGKYVTSQSVLSSDFQNRTKLSFTKTPNYTAPDKLYRSLRDMGRNASTNMGFNLTWRMPVDSGFFYLLRLHFCQLNPLVNQTGDLIFYIFIQDQLVEDMADVLSWSNKQRGVPVVREIGPTGISTTHVNTDVKGSIGYLDPEYYKRHRLTEKSDVYSFAVVLLEVLSGREPLLRWEDKQRMSLVNWAKRCYEKGTLREIVDPELKGQIAPQCLRKFGEVLLSCLLEDGNQRPSMHDDTGRGDSATNHWLKKSTKGQRLATLLLVLTFLGLQIGRGVIGLS
ncbi:putative receptor protein kinase [Spatholobus suberectus]|nr:putative receptor protein kinase [Spatholobus suberectus]